MEYLVHHDMKLGWNTITRATNTNHWTCFWPRNKPSAIVLFRLHFQGTTTRKDSVQCAVRQKNTVRNFTLKFTWQKSIRASPNRFVCFTFSISQPDISKKTPPPSIGIHIAYFKLHRWDENQYLLDDMMMERWNFRG